MDPYAKMYETPESLIDWREVANSHMKIAAKAESELFQIERNLYFSEKKLETQAAELSMVYRSLRETQSELKRLRSATCIFGVLLLIAIVTNIKF